MAGSISAQTLEKFTTFGDLLRYLRRRMGLTQLELSIAVGYSDAQITRLEKNQRPADIPTIEARFVEALGLENEPEAAARLLDLAARVSREDAPSLGMCPYKGMEYFDEGDAELFVGREALTAELAQRVLALAGSDGKSESRFLAIVGASGSGKSSLVRAGLVPALHWNKSSADWPIRILTPTARPLESLAASLAPVTSSLAETAALMDDLARDGRSLDLYAKWQLTTGRGSRMVLVIDQFEELFALCRSEKERAAFIEDLLTAASAADGPVIVVITLRADFYAHCAAYPQLREALAAQQEYIGAMSGVELRRAIEEPARRGNWELEPGLVDLLLHEVGSEPGGLPLLSHALLETWQRRRGRTMTLGGYASSGGVRGAIAETAEEVFTDQFSHEQQAIARRIFLRLTELGEETSTGDTRRRATFDELVLKPEETDATRAVLTALADARLITISEDAAEVAHEALIREWPTLRGWLEDNREGLRLHRQLTEAAQEWSAGGRDPDALYRGTRLAQAGEWAIEHAEDLNTLEQEFLAASNQLSERLAAEHVAQQQRELEAARKLAEMEQRRADTELQRAEEQARAAGRLRRRAYLLGGALALAILLMGVAAFFGNSANRSATAAQESALTAQQNASAARDAQATAQAERDSADVARSSALSRELAAQSKLNLDQDPELSILLGLAAYDTAPSKEALEALHQAVQTSRILVTLKAHDGPIPDIALSPDAKLFASAGFDETVKVWETETGAELSTLAGHTGTIWAVRFSPNGAQLASASDDSTVKLWDVATGKERLTIDIGQPDQTVDFGPDGTWLVSDRGDSQVRFWDTATGSELFALSSPDWTSSARPWQVSGETLSADGTRLAIYLCTEDGDCRVEIWDVPTRQRIRILFEGSADLGNSNSMAFSPDNLRLAVTRTEANSTPASVWDLDSGRRLYYLGSSLNMVKFSADGRHLFSSTGGGKTNIWDAATGQELVNLPGNRAQVIAVAVNSYCPEDTNTGWCGTRLVSGLLDGTVKVWDIAPDGRGEGLVLPGAPFAVDTDWSHVTTQVAASDAESGETTTSFRRWAIPAWTRAGLSRLAAPSTSSIDTPAGSVGTENWREWWTDIAADGTIRFLDFAGPGRSPVSVCCFDTSGNNAPGWATWSPGARLLAVSGSNGVVQIWDLAAGQELEKLSEYEPGGVGSMAFSPDGKRLAISSEQEGNTKVWDLATRQALFTLPAEGSPSWTTFSPDGKLLASGNCEGTLSVWEATTGEVKDRLKAHSACITPLVFSPDGTRIATTSSDRTTRIWDLASGEELLNLPMGGLLGPTNLAFSPDGNTLLASLDYNNAGEFDTRMFLLNPDDLVALAKTRVTRSLTTEECQQYLHVEECPPEP